jgi:hypothetical protein
MVYRLNDIAITLLILQTEDYLGCLARFAPVLYQILRGIGLCYKFAAISANIVCKKIYYLAYCTIMSDNNVTNVKKRQATINDMFKKRARTQG